MNIEVKIEVTLKGLRGAAMKAAGMKAIWDIKALS
jgi:lipid A disaccharide synthetase